MSATPLSATPAASPSQAQQAYEGLRDMLIRLEIPPGAPLSDAELIAHLGVGRTPLREAVNRLVEERLVVKYARRGTFAADINLADLPLRTDLREELAGLAAASAAERHDAEDAVVLRGLLTRLDGPQPPSGHMDTDVAIHRAIYAAAHNPFVEESATRYHNLSTRMWFMFMDRLTGLGSHVAEHEALIRHILAGRGEDARQTARDHVRTFATAVRALL